MLARCWAPQPNDRPSIEDVLQCLDVFSNSQELFLELDEGIGEDSDEEDSTDDDGSSGIISLFALHNFSWSQWLSLS